MQQHWRGCFHNRTDLRRRVSAARWRTGYAGSSSAHFSWGKLRLPPVIMARVGALVCIEAVNVSVRRGPRAAVRAGLHADCEEGAGVCTGMQLRGHFHVARGGDKTVNTAQDLVAVHNRRLGRAI